MDERKARIGELIDELRGQSFFSENEVQRALISRCLAELGWILGVSNTEVWLGFDDEMAAYWNYSPRQKRMRRDYVLSSPDGRVHPRGSKEELGWLDQIGLVRFPRSGQSGRLVRYSQ